jgi:hypothetical protein
MLCKVFTESNRLACTESGKEWNLLSVVRAGRGRRRQATTVMMGGRKNFGGLFPFHAILFDAGNKFILKEAEEALASATES